MTVLAAAVASTVLSGVLAIIGVRVGKTWERQSTTESWWREQRLTTYTDFIAAARAVLRSLEGATGRPDDDRRQAIKRLNDLYHVRERVRLIGPTSVQESASGLVVALTLVASSSSSPSDEDSPVNRGMEQFANTEMDFIDAAQQALT